MTGRREGPLSGVRILDLTRVLAGPFGTMLLGDAGAEIIKVEPITGDDTRAWGPPFAAGESAYYLSVNRNKSSIALDLSDPRGQEILLRLVAQSDVLVENFKLGTMERWGLGYQEVLRPLNPGLIYASISGFGRTGPYAPLPGYDVVVEAMGGLMSITGEPDGDPMKVGVAIVDVLTGCLAAYGVAAALHERKETGEGQQIDLSLLDTQIAALANQAGSYLLSGKVPPRLGNGHPSIVPYQVFRARDRQIMVAVGNDRQFRNLCLAIERSDLADDPRYGSNPGRVQYRDELIGQIQATLAERDCDEWAMRLTKAGVPVAPINTLDHVFADPQVIARGLVQEVEHPTAGKIRLPGTPVRFEGTVGRPVRHPPLLGEHTHDLLAELGYTPEEIESLAAVGVIRGASKDSPAGI